MRFRPFRRMRTLELPEGVELVEAPRGLRFRGTAHELLAVAQQVRTLKDGAPARVGRWRLAVSDAVPATREERTVTLPGHAWNIAASKIAEVATNWESSPFDFGDCAYLTPPPDPDVGVELVGEPIDDRPSATSGRPAS